MSIKQARLQILFFLVLSLVLPGGVWHLYAFEIPQFELESPFLRIGADFIRNNPIFERNKNTTIQAFKALESVFLLTDEAKMVVLGALPWADFYKFDDERYHAQTPSYKPNDKQDREKQIRIGQQAFVNLLDRLIRLIKKHAEQGASDKALFLLGVASHLVQDLVYHRGMTRQQEAGLSYVFNRNPDLPEGDLQRQREEEAKLLTIKLIAFVWSFLRPEAWSKMATWVPDDSFNFPKRADNFAQEGSQVSLRNTLEFYYLSLAYSALGTNSRNKDELDENPNCRLDVGVTCWKPEEVWQSIWYKPRTNIEIQTSLSDTLDASIDTVQKGVFRALVIGVKTYKDDLRSNPPLKLDDAANLIAEAFREVAHKQGFNDTQIQIEILNGAEGSKNPPGKIEILETLGALSKDSLPEDKLFLYFTGHGNQDLIFTSGSNSFSTHRAIKAEELKKEIDGSAAEEKLIFIDTCQRLNHDSTLAGPLSSFSPPVKIEKNKAWFLSAEKGQDSHIDESLGFGYFTKHLLAGLKEGAADGYTQLGKVKEPDGTLTVNELQAYIYRKVKEEVRDKKKSDQTPDILTSIDFKVF